MTKLSEVQAKKCNVAVKCKPCLCTVYKKLTCICAYKPTHPSNIFAGIVREREDRYELEIPTLFIFGEKDTVISLDQVRLTKLRLLPTTGGVKSWWYIFCMFICMFVFFFKPRWQHLRQNWRTTALLTSKWRFFPNQTHGFVHRKREDINSTDRPHIQEARQDMIDWLNKYL